LIGANSALVALVKMADGAYVGSGSAITADARPTRWPWDVADKALKKVAPSACGSLSLWLKRRV
jgi:bifunctional N-acetylglucosamine-1-phosphate-uridyltransferase/glucosamine-1-phosphate-acetyltransferase GlmU-like protein